MIRKLIRVAAAALVYFCVATLISQSILLAYVAYTWEVNGDKLFRALAAVHGLDPDAEEKDELLPPEDVPEDVSYQQIIAARLSKSLDMDLREQGLIKRLDHLQALLDQVVTANDDLDRRQLAFREELIKLEAGAEQEGLAQVQRTIEAMQPAQAKDQILKLLETDSDAAVLSMVKAMPVDRRKKIAAEFQTEEDAEKLHEILLRILLGEPETSLIDTTRNQLGQANQP